MLSLFVHHHLETVDRVVSDNLTPLAENEHSTSPLGRFRGVDRRVPVGPAPGPGAWLAWIKGPTIFFFAKLLHDGNVLPFVSTLRTNS